MRLHKLLCSRGLLSACVLATGLGVGGKGVAEPVDVEPATDALRLSGFGTVGASRTSAPHGWGFQRESVQPSNDGGTRFDTDTRLGLQANYAINLQLEMVGQLLLTRRIPDTPVTDSVAWAFAAYRPTEGLTVRAGRVSADIFLLSDYRSVGLAYPFVRPPTEFYGVLPSTFDGVDVSQSWRDGTDAIWKLNGLYGRSKQGDSSSGYRTLRPLYAVTLSRDEQGLLIKGSMARARFASDVPRLAPLIAALQPLTSLPVSEVAADAATLQQQLTLHGQAVDYFGLGINFDRDDWLWMLEASRVSVRGISRLDAGYALLGRRFGRFTPYVVLSAARTTEMKDRPQWAAALAPFIGAAGAAQAQGLGDLAYNAANIGPSQRTVSAGLRWDATAQAAIKFQYERTRIGERGGPLWANSTDEPASAHVLTLTLDFVF